MEKDKELFTPILGQGEEILKVYRPNKLRAFFTQILCWAIVAIIVVPLVIYSAIVDVEFGLIGAIFVILLFAILGALCFLITGLWVNKTVYALTNKRVLIRTGYIGVDYKSLDYDMLGAVTVNVNWVDKLLHKNTGSIAFGSMSSPLVSTGLARFSFFYIGQPYEIYKEVKAIIDANKDLKVNNI